MSLNILAVELSPNPVNTEEYYTIKVTVEECTHKRLEKYTHAQLNAYTHEQLSKDKLNT